MSYRLFVEWEAKRRSEAKPVAEDSPPPERGGPDEARERKASRVRLELSFATSAEAKGDASAAIEFLREAEQRIAAWRAELEAGPHRATGS